MFDAYLLPREQRIAHLEVHGWMPVKDSANDARSFRGIWSEQLTLGFAVSRSIAGKRVIRLDSDYPRPVECSWADIPTEVLDAIDARLAET